MIEESTDCAASSHEIGSRRAWLESVSMAEHSGRCGEKEKKRKREKERRKREFVLGLLRHYETWPTVEANTV